jgi:hypothetical protein
MSTLAERILRVAEAEIGTVEAPPGSNRGREVGEYQASTYLAGTGWAWCGAFVCWTWQHAGLERALAQRIASPSVAIMCQTAEREGLVCSPRPGAAIAWCGTHVELLHSPMGAGVWRTIGGNTEDGVRWRTRALAGAVVFGPPGLEDIAAEVVAQPLFWLEDVAARYEVIGRWKRRAYADNALSRLEPATRARAKVVALGGGDLALRVGEPRHYGPWAGGGGRAVRDAVRAKLERRLGRQLRPYRTERMPRAPQGAAEALGKTT